MLKGLFNLFNNKQLACKSVQKLQNIVCQMGHTYVLNDSSIIENICDVLVWKERRIYSVFI